MNYSIGRGSPYTGKTFQVRDIVGEQLSSGVVRVKKADLWLV